MLLPNLLPKFKVVEVNNSVALRNGHMLAQSPAYQAGFANTLKTAGTYKFLENGLIVCLDSDGTVIENAAGATQPFIIYTEELDAGPLNGLNQFAEVFEDAAVAVYPRCLALYVGDTFTTDNISGAIADGFATITNGQITMLAASGDAFFKVTKTTLPDGTTVAGECLFVGKVAVVI